MGLFDFIKKKLFGKTKKIEETKKKSEDKSIKKESNVLDKKTTSIEKKPSIEKPYDKLEINSINSLIEIVEKEKEVELKYDLERNVKLVSFNKGKINISFNDKLNKNFIKTLTEKLLQWTGERWIISLSKNAEAKSIYEQNLESKENNIKKFEEGKFTKEFRDAFPDAKLIEIKDKE